MSRTLSPHLRFMLCLAIILHVHQQHRIHAQATSEWPFYRHDARLTARSEAVGNLTAAPVPLWRYYLGGWQNVFEVTFAHNQRGTLPIRNDDLGPYTEPPNNRLIDLTGNGALVPRPVGKVAKLFPDIPGLQQVTWEQHPDKPYHGVGRCYAFDQGSDQPRLLWETDIEPEVYEMLWTIADMDGDELPEVVFMTHYRIIVYNGQTGEKKSTLKWPIGRNYGQITLADIDGDQLPEAVVVVDSPPHVNALKYAPGEGQLLWSQRYITSDQVSLPIELKLRLVPNHVHDLDGDGRAELVYNLFNFHGDFRWHVEIRDALSGEVKYDLPNKVLWGVVDIDSPPTPGPDAIPSLMTLCCLEAPGRSIPEFGTACLLQFHDSEWKTIWNRDSARWQMTDYDWPLTEDTIASLGPAARHVPYRVDIDGDGRDEVFVTTQARTVRAIGKGDGAAVAEKWSLSGPRGSQPSVEGIHSNQARVLVNFDAQDGEVVARNCRPVQVKSGPRNNFQPLPTRPLATVVDLDGDGTNEVLAQDSHWHTRVLRFGPGDPNPTEVLRVRGGGLWLGRRWAAYPYSKFPVYALDANGDGQHELFLTDVDNEVNSTISCRNHQGQVRWQKSLSETPAQSIVWMAGGHFVDQTRLDLLVVVQSGLIGECFCLRSDTGETLWRMAELKTADGTPFHFGSHAPFLAVADFDTDGFDDICGQSGQHIAVIKGATGKQLAVPRSMIHDLFPRWVTYGLTVVGDWDQSGRPSMFTNTTINGFGLVDPSLNATWFADLDGQPRTLVGSIGKTEQDDSWTFGTFAETTFKSYDMKTGAAIVSEHLDLGPTTITTEVIAADVDGDHRDEFLAVASNVLLCIRGDRADGPRIKWKVTLPTAASELAFADANNDGQAEVLFTGVDGYLYSFGKQP